MSDTRPPVTLLALAGTRYTDATPDPGAPCDFSALQAFSIELYTSAALRVP